MRLADEKKLENLYIEMNHPADYRSGDENNPGSPSYVDNGLDAYIDSYWDKIVQFLSDDWGPINLLSVDIDGDYFIVKFQYQDDDGSIQDTTERIRDYEVGADLNPEPDI